MSFPSLFVIFVTIVAFIVILQKLPILICKQIDFNAENIKMVRLKNQVKLSRLTITKDYGIILTDYNKEVKMEPLVKAVYLLFLNHAEGIAFKALPTFRDELTSLYSKLRPYGLNDQAIKSIGDVTNPLNNSINEKCSRIRAAFLAEVDETLANQYYITGKSGEPKRITLPRNLVVWE